MALNAVPGLGEVTMAAQAASMTAKGAIGEKQYDTTRSVATWGWSAAQGFLPINPILLPFQIGMFVVFVIMLIIVFGFSGKIFVAAYVMQALVITIGFQWILDKFLTYGVGI